jgi:hypothetical protein
VVYRHGELGGLAERDRLGDVPDVADDVGIRAQERAEQVAAADDADELALQLDFCLV